jgi:homopolymeric O-antigen transport system permease protein
MTAPATRDLALARSGATPTVVVRPTRGFAFPDPKELWHYRELVYFLAWRDVKVRYAQTLLGAAWTIFQPLALVLVFTFAFRNVAHINTEDIAYPVFALSGVVFWTFFSRAVAQGSDSLVANAPLLTKIYCPRVLIPVAAIVSGLVDFALGLVFFIGFAAFYGYYPTWRLALVPPLLLLGVVFATGLALLLSAINVRFRDVRYGLPFLIQIWLFLSPVAYPLENPLFALNPLVGIIDAFRWALLGTTSVDAPSVALAGGIAALVLVVGLAHFSRVERTFADYA